MNIKKRDLSYYGGNKVIKYKKPHWKDDTPKYKEKTILC